MKKLICLALLLFATNPVKGQSCSATISNFKDSLNFSGSGMQAGSYAIEGGGQGLPGVGNTSPTVASFNAAFATPSGDIYWASALMSVTATPFFVFPLANATAGILVYLQSYTSPGWIYEVERFDTLSNHWYLTFSYAQYIYSQGGWVYTNIYNQDLGSYHDNGVPEWMVLQRVSGIWYFYTATNGANYVLRGSWTPQPGTFDPTDIGPAVWSSTQDAGVTTSATFVGTSLNGSTFTPSNDQDYNVTTNFGHGSPMTQGGNLSIGPNYISFHVAPNSYCGTSITAQALDLFALQNSTGSDILQSPADGSAAQGTKVNCSSGCDVTVTNPGNGPVVITHGQTYTLREFPSVSMVGNIEQQSIPLYFNVPINP